MQVTKKSVLAKYHTIICLPYASAQHLLSLETRSAHTSGIYGWNADVYHFSTPHCAIVTGYRGFGNVRPSDRLISTFERPAEMAISALPYDQAMPIVKDLLDRFIRAAIAGHNGNK